MSLSLFASFALLHATAFAHGFGLGNTQFPFTTLPLDDIDIATEPFNGLTTFAHLPYVNCFANSTRLDGEYDIAFVGAPFDTGVSARPGARYGPSGIRRGSARIRPSFHYDIETGYNAFTDWATIIDCGDVAMIPFDNRIALAQLEKGHKLIAGRVAKAQSKASVPRIVTLGGDHTITLAALRAAHKVWGEVSVLHFDSHIDTWNPTRLGGGLTDYSAVNHGTFLHIAHEEGLISNQSMHAGIRAIVSNEANDRKNDQRCGFEFVTAHAIDKIGTQGIIDRIKDRIGDKKVYVSVDIDVLDPAFAPATGTAEVGGWTTRELKTILYGLEGLNVIGADVVEVAPIYDNPGETTQLAAADVAIALMTLMVKKPVKP